MIIFPIMIAIFSLLYFAQWTKRIIIAIKLMMYYKMLRFAKCSLLYILTDLKDNGFFINNIFELT